jgi:membrane-associated protease RseP (regulator of RpoE activity)
MNQEETTQRGKGWKWAAVVLTGLVILLITCAVSALWGGLLGYMVGRGTARQAQIPQPYDRSPYMVPEQPIPEMPDFPWDLEQRAWLGVTFVMTPEGAQITSVVSGSPAESAGIQRGDVITAVDGNAVTADAPLNEQILQYSPGDRVAIKLVREGRIREVTVVLGSRMQGELPWLPDDFYFERPVQPNWQG